MTLDEWIDTTAKRAEHVLDNVTFSANTGEDLEAGRIAAYQGGFQVGVIETLKDLKAVIQTEHLYAAAPDMLKALKAIDDFWTSLHPEGPDGGRGFNHRFPIVIVRKFDVWRTIRAAIAKAGGTQS